MDKNKDEELKKTTGGVRSLPRSKDEIVRLLQLIPHPEGGYFRETWRSGVVPMQSRGQTNTNVDSSSRDLVLTDRKNRPNDSGQRNALTSIFWVPTLQSSKVLLAINFSDHVHYYQGGRPFEYFLYRPQLSETTLSRVVLGPDLLAGHQLQVCVAGGTWKCGKILEDKGVYSADTMAEDEVEYSIIGEAVGPGFDVYDFAWVTLEQIDQQSLLDENAKQLLKTFLHPMNQSTTLKEIDEHYDDEPPEYCSEQ